MSWRPGERIVLLSDGITEAEDPAGTMFAHGKMNEYLSNVEPVAALFDGLRTFCKGAHAQDDQTVLTIERVG